MATLCDSKDMIFMHIYSCTIDHDGKKVADPGALLSPCDHKPWSSVPNDLHQQTQVRHGLGGATDYVKNQLSSSR
jgi:hypothetical protein